jgi:arylsulfatase A-like enzyme
MTGRYSFRLPDLRWENKPLIEDGRTTPPSVLRGAGHHTTMVGKWLGCNPVTPSFSASSSSEYF